MKKRIFAFLLTAVLLLSLLPTAAMAGNVVSISDAAEYKKDNLSGGYLTFYAGVSTFRLEGTALQDLYYDPTVKYYVFRADGIEVTADKNAFYDFNITGAQFTIGRRSFNVSYIYGDKTVAQTTAKMPVSYTVASDSSSALLTGKFSSGYAQAVDNSAGKLTFRTDKLGAFTVEDFRFDDVKDSGKWYYNYVNAAGAYGILSGVDGKNFQPNVRITRAELAAMIVKATQDVVSYRIDDSIAFSDVPEQKWYHDYIIQCASLGIMSGVGDGSFSPENSASRQEIATVVARLLTLIGSYGNEPLPTALDPAELSALYADADTISSYARSPVLLCYQLGIMRGDNTGFRPKDNVLRCECAKIFRLISRELNKLR